MAILRRHKKSSSSSSLVLSGTSLASVESLTMPLVQEVVLLADFRCAKCQKRVAEIISRMNGEMESVVVSVLEKKVTLTCRSFIIPMVKAPAQPLAAIYKMPLSKVMTMTRLFRSSLS
ncbi:hypothetical protein Vadar_019642 [Vaccinium darrowii]|uniref:Uncharacterized protein n=1 Tax=Vaccinium darrowii TaxID=229202 RepID=A0ACB7XIP1_9ERIC|nr:hypothetical protein Vadar_019642 [Vaccinium darrowii]